MGRLRQGEVSSTHRAKFVILFSLFVLLSVCGRKIADLRQARRPPGTLPKGSFAAFTVHYCQAIWADVLEKMVQTNEIELQNFLHWPCLSF
jgi:hypothetical protein